MLELTDALIPPLERRQSSMDYPELVEILGAIYDRYGQPMTNTLLRRSDRLFQAPVKDYIPDANMATVVVDNGIFAGVITSHYGHFLLETLSRVSALFANRKAKIIFQTQPEETGLVLNRYPQWQQCIIEALALDIDQVVLIDGLTRVKKLIVPDPGFVIQDYCSRQHATAMAELGRRLKNRFPTSRRFSRPVWLSRSQLTNRTVHNESVLEQALEAEGFEIIHPQNLTVVEQFSLFEQSEVVAGFMGSGFHNILLVNTPTAHLMHFSRSHGIDSGYRTCASAKGFKADFYSYFISDTPVEPWGRNSVIDLNAVWETLRNSGWVSKPQSFE